MRSNSRKAPKRALVTGCAGFIGSHLTESLLSDGVEVLGIDCFNANYGRKQKLENLKVALDWDHFQFLPLDLSRGDLAELVRDIDVVFHLAAEPGVRSSWGDRFQRYVTNNILATQHLLRALGEVPDVRLVYASSSSIYGQAETLPTSEDAPAAPISPYGLTKLSGEHLCNVFHANHGLDVVSLRYFTVFGPRQRPDMAFNIFGRKVLSGDPIEVYGDGHQTRDFTYVADIVAGTRSAAVSEIDSGSAYNLGGGLTASLRDVLGTIQEIAGTTADITYGTTQAGDVRDTGADTSRARRDLDFNPATRLSDGLAAEVEWLSTLPLDVRGR